MLKPGELVGPYEIRGFIGQGGMGRVYRAFDPRLERTVALKVIVVPDQGSANDSARLSGEFSARLLREARAVASLSHPNVVGIFDVGEHDGRLYLAMEYVVGATLRTLATSDVPLARKLRWLVDVARALEAAHKAGLVHRDVKPENVMIREDGAVKVLDFGIARRTMAQGGAEDERVQDTVTGGGVIAGTPVYMAPEQIRGKDVDARSDQFAWGVTAYEVISGVRPWADTGDVLQVVARVLTEPPMPLEERTPGTPQPVADTILRALSKEPVARFASMADVADVLEPFAMQTTGGGSRIPVRVNERREDASAFAATTRIPTSVSVSAPVDRAEAPAEAEKTWAVRKIAQLAIPLLLLATLIVAVYVAQKLRPTTTTPTSTPTPTPSGSAPPRPLSTVHEADVAFREAMLLWHDGSTAKARASLRRSVELDPTFSAAHLEIAIQTVQEDPVSAQAAFQSAFEHRQMLLPRDVSLLEASEPYVRPKPDLLEWETRLSRSIFEFPRDPELQLFLGRARDRQGDDEGAKEAYEAAVRLDPGFVPALAALAGTERNLGRPQEALAATERCIKQSPVATTCVETRYRLLSEIGECGRAREEAVHWRALDPQSPAAAAALARALHATGAPRPGVEEALARSWALTPEAKRAPREQWDRMLLAIVDGQLGPADDLARTYEAQLPAGADQFDHAQPARVRINVLYESEQTEAAVKAAHGYLDRMDAWAAYPFATDPSIDFYEPLYRSGEITKVELERQRSLWVEREKQRLAGGDQRGRAAWATWALWGGFAETREEALEALARIPRDVAPPVGGRRPVTLDFALGKVQALVGHANEAIPPLLRVAGTCASLDESMLVVRAHYYLGLAHEAKGDRPLARAEYAQVVAAWPKETPSRTVRWARARLEALAK